MNEHNNYNYYNCKLDENTINSDNYNINYSKPSKKNKIQQTTKDFQYKDVRYNNEEFIR